MKRSCKQCNRELQVEDFPIAGIVNGITYYRHKCVQCYSIQKVNERKSLQSKFEDFKKTLSCEHCGTNDYRVLEFHHVDSEDKENHISKMVMNKNSWKRIMKEVAKCICLCANCHRIVHYREKNLLGVAQSD